jgi:1,4-alpha-glucan branching enzyme
MRTPIEEGGITEHDIYLMKEGSHTRLYDKLGCHLTDTGARFAVWAPNARHVAVIGEFNNWNANAPSLGLRQDDSGVWEGEIAGVKPGAAYKFRITPRTGEPFDKADPCALATEEPPRTASRAYALDYEWNDGGWMSTRRQRNALDAPISIYELHLGSWRRRDGDWLPYREIAEELARYVSDMGFTHVELMPICEHPFYGSWGYQVTGYFAPTARYGTPQDFKYLVDTLHQAWHRRDARLGALALSRPMRTAWRASTARLPVRARRSAPGLPPGMALVDLQLRPHEVRAFLLSSALFWLDEYPLRRPARRRRGVDAVPGLFAPGRRVDPQRPRRPREPGGDGFLRLLNDIHLPRLSRRAGDREESTAWPMVSRPVLPGWPWLRHEVEHGLDARHAQVLAGGPAHRATITAPAHLLAHLCVPRELRAAALARRGRARQGLAAQQDAGRRLAAVRQPALLLGYMWAHPGKKLLFMGGEFAQRASGPRRRA